MTTKLRGGGVRAPRVRAVRMPATMLCLAASAGCYAGPPPGSAPLATGPAAAAVLAAAARDGGAVLTNPGFEGAFAPVSSRSDGDNKNADIGGMVAPGWSDNSNWADVTVRYAEETKDVHSGKSAQRVRVVGVRGGGAAQMIASPEVAFKKGQVYRFRVWLKGDNGTSVELHLRQAGPPYASYATRPFLLGGGWRECEISGVAGDDTPGFLMLRVTAPGEFLADDALFENLTAKVSDAAPRTGNLLPNASFEAGGTATDAVWATGGWNARFESIGSPANAIRFAFDDPRPRRDTATPAAVGKASLRIDLPADAVATVQSPSFNFNYGRPHVVSFWAKADRPVGGWAELRGANLAGSAAITTEWKRHTITGTPTYRSTAYLSLRVESPGVPNRVWVDGVQIEEAAAASPEYRPNAPAELVLTCAKPGHVFRDGEKPVVTAKISGAPRGATLRISVEDIYGNRSSLPNLPVGGAETRVSVPGKKRGVFKLRAVAHDSAGRVLSAPAECVYAVLPTPRTLAPESSFFGIHAPLAPEFLALSVATGHRWNRLHDTSMVGKWAATEPIRGAWNWEDRGVNAAKKAGVAVLGLLDGAPAWATTKPREGYWGFWNIPDAPRATDAWSNYVRVTAGHYKGVIDHWEIWNEPWGEWWLSSGNPAATPALYGDLLKRAHTEARAVNPAAVIVGIDSYRTPNADRDWTPPALAAAPPRHFEVFSFHLYDGSLMGGPTPPSKQSADYFRTAQETAGGPVRPLWNTEGGPGEIGSFYAPEAGGIPASIQPAYAVRYDVTMMGNGVQKYFLYAAHTDPQVEETNYRATEYDRAIRPILGARAVLASLVDGAVCLGRTEPVAGVDAYAFDDRAGKRRVTVCWSYSGGRHELPLPKGATAFDVWGNRLASTKGRVTVGIEPVYFVR